MNLPAVRQAQWSRSEAGLTESKANGLSAQRSKKKIYEKRINIFIGGDGHYGFGTDDDRL